MADERAANRNRLWLIAYLAFFLALSFVKAPRVLIEPRFWAEDGAFYFAHFRSLDLWSALTYVANGNYQLLTNVLVYLATRVPLAVGGVTEQVRLPQSELRGRGGLTMADQQLQFRLEIPRLQLDEFPLSLPPEVPRQMQGTITANGSLQAPRVEARLTYAGARIGADLEAQLHEALPRYQVRLRVEALNVASRGELMAQFVDKAVIESLRQATENATEAEK